MTYFTWIIYRLQRAIRHSRGRLSKKLPLAVFAVLLMLLPLDATAEELPTRSQALALLQAGYLLHITGDFETATSVFRESIQLHPTAEAHTYLGWSLSHLGELDKAIEHCKIAIGLDPEFGNPYNDIGVYLMELGRFEEAEPWLRKAIASERYCCYHYAHANLGEILMRQGQLSEARRSFARSLEYAPDYPPARNALKYIGDLGETL